MKKILVLFCTAIFLFSFSQKTMNILEYKNSPKVFNIKGLSQAVSIDCGTSKMVLLSGQVPLDTDGNLIGNNVEEQTQQIFKNIDYGSERIWRNSERHYKIRNIYHRYV
ncbi:RidA family protein [Chryseobacterium sp. WG23]|uniref:RidA family protein n=1 Tax=Chryseobacterium sp. WG23 TaxID=2926910 RepID=UPI00211E2E4D|nr:RidA family protein [Chryseobacterium sp. WG23]